MQPETKNRRGTRRLTDPVLADERFNIEGPDHRTGPRTEGLGLNTIWHPHLSPLLLQSTALRRRSGVLETTRPHRPTASSTVLEELAGEGALLSQALRHALPRHVFQDPSLAGRLPYKELRVLLPSAKARHEKPVWRRTSLKVLRLVM